MDLSPAPAEERLRADVRAWLREHLPWEYGQGLPPRFDDLAEEVAFGRRWQASLAADHWVGVTWPEAYGGRGAGPTEHFIVQEELARARAPEMVGRIGINLAGPTLLAHGTEAQSLAGCRSILTAGELWCQLFSEPGAGSDLAVSPRGPRRSTGAGCSTDRRCGRRTRSSPTGACAWPGPIRTPPSTGGSPTWWSTCTHPGVEVRPLVQLTGEAEFNEVFLSGVFVPSDQLVGPEHEGWRVANSTLSHERGTNPRQLVIHMQLLEELLRLAAATGASTTSGSVSAWPRPSSRYGSSSCTTSAASADCPRARTRARGQRPQALLERDVQAVPRHRHGRTGRRRPTAAGGPRTTRAGASGSGRGSTTRRPRCGPAPTRSSAPSSASGCSACPDRPPAETGA